MIGVEETMGVTRVAVIGTAERKANTEKEMEGATGTRATGNTKTRQVAVIGVREMIGATKVAVIGANQVIRASKVIMASASIETNRANDH